MKTRANELDGKRRIRFTKEDIKLATAMLDDVKTTIEMIYFLMNRGDEEAFVIILLDAGGADIADLIDKQKRDTDILFELDEERHVYALVCQDTKVDGGYHFSERLLKVMRGEHIDAPYCIELEVRNTVHDIKYLIYKSIRMLAEVRKENRFGEILFKTVH